MRGVTRVTGAAACAAGTLAALQVARASGVVVPRPALVVAAVVSMVLAAAVSARTVAFVWRGPDIISFRRRDAVLCDAAEAAAVRTAAQLRGTMGGAGHVHRFRLAFPAIAWAAVAAQSAAFLVAGEAGPAPWPLAIAFPAALLSLLLPARSFWYREVTGGCVLAHPCPACLHLLQVAGVGPALTRFDPNGPGPRATGEWGNSPNVTELGCVRQDDEARPDG